MTFNAFKNIIRWMSFAAILLMLPILSAVAQELETPQIVPDTLESPAPLAQDLHSLMLIGTNSYGGLYVAVGERGVILTSRDGGKSWTQAEHVPVSVTLIDVWFTSDQQGWAVGHSGVLLKTVDGGVNWELVLDGRKVAQSILDSAKTRQAEGIEGADGEVRGAQYLVDEGPDKPLLKVFFDSTEHGWVLGAYGIFLETDDGGQSWHNSGYRIPNKFGAHLYGMERVGDRLLIVGEQGAVFASDDDGAQFYRIESPYEGSFFGLVGESASSAILFGLRGNVWHLEFAETVEATERGDKQDRLREPAVPIVDWYQIENGPPVTVSAGARLPDGRTVLADQSGRLTIAELGATETSPVPVSGAGTITGLEIGEDGAVIVTGPRGPQKIENVFDAVGNK